MTGWPLVWSDHTLVNRIEVNSANPARSAQRFVVVDSTLPQCMTMDFILVAFSGNLYRLLLQCSVSSLFLGCQTGCPCPNHDAKDTGGRVWTIQLLAGRA